MLPVFHQRIDERGRWRISRRSVFERYDHIEASPGNNDPALLREPCRRPLECNLSLTQS